MEEKTLAAKLEEVLVSVEPSPIFVEHLRWRLMALARQRDIRLARSHKREILLGAALGSIVSAAWLIAHLLHSSRKTQHAASG